MADSTSFVTQCLKRFVAGELAGENQAVRPGFVDDSHVGVPPEYRHESLRYSCSCPRRQRGHLTSFADWSSLTPLQRRVRRTAVRHQSSWSGQHRTRYWRMSAIHSCVHRLLDVLRAFDNFAEERIGNAVIGVHAVAYDGERLINDGNLAQDDFFFVNDLARYRLRR